MSINIKELRLGNLVRGASGVAYISKIEKESINLYITKAIYLYEPAFSIDNEFIQGIELTNEIINKTRINEENGEVHNELFSGKMAVGRNMNPYYWCFYIGTEFIKYIKYLHELQNLYYSLTGEELEIKQFKLEES